MTTRVQRDHDTAIHREHQLQAFRLFLSGYLAGSVIHMPGDVELDLHTTGSDYLPSFTVRRGTLGLVVSVDVEICP